MTKSFLFAVVPLLFLFVFSYGQTLDKNLWAANGPVHAFARDSSTLYMAGNFDYVYPNAGGGAAINMTNGMLHNYQFFPHINGTVYACVADGSGGWYIGGSFSMVGDVPRKGLAHLLADNQVDPDWVFNAEALAVSSDTTHEIHSLVIHDNTLFVGGRFAKIAEQPRKFVAAIDLPNRTLADWNPMVEYAWPGHGYLPGVRSIVIVSNTVYLGGTFSRVGDAARTNLAAVDIHSGELLPWAPYPDDAVFSLLPFGNRIYVGGGFTKMSSLDRQSIAAVDAVTGEVVNDWRPWVAPTPHISQSYGRPFVSTMLIHNNVLYVGGKLSLDHAWTGPFFNRMMALNATTGGYLWEKRVNGVVYDFAVANGQLYVSGRFSTIDYTLTHTGSEEDGYARTHLAAIDLATLAVTDWQPTAIEGVYTLTVAGDKMYAGGGPGMGLGGYRRNKAAAIDASTGRPSDWNVEGKINGYVTSIAVTDNAVFLGGVFNAETGAKHLLAADKVSGKIKPWTLSADSTVHVLLSRGNTVFVGGEFRTVGGSSRSRLAAVDATTGTITRWNPGADGGVHTLSAVDNTLYAGGAFLAIAGKSIKYLAALDATNGQARNLNIVVDGLVKASAIASNNILYIGGYFYNVNGTSRKSLAALNARTGSLLRWQSDYITNDYGTSIYTLTVQENRVYVGGMIRERSDRVRGIAALDALTGKVMWQPGWGQYDAPRIYASIHLGGKLYLGGSFRNIGDAGTTSQSSLSYWPHVAAFGGMGTPVPQYNAVSGRIFHDVNNNCTQEPGEKALPDVIVMAEPGRYFSISDSLGNYTIRLDTGTYTIRQVLPEEKNTFIAQTCPAAPATHAVSFKSSNNTVTGKDFGNQVTLRPYLAASVASTRRRRCFAANTTVTYCNDGSLAADGVKVHLALPEYVVLGSATTPYTRDKDGHYVFNVGRLPARQCGTIQIRDSVVCNNPDIRGLSQCTKVWITPANPTTPAPGWDQSDITLKAKCLANGRVRLGFYNTGTGAMTDSSAYRVYLDAGLALSRKFKLAAGDSLLLQVPANGQTVRLEADQRPGHPSKQSTSVAIEGCGTNTNGNVSLGFVAQLPADDAEPEVDVECLPITDSFDPNDKLVLPAGLSGQHLTAFGQELEYTVRFQNTGNDYAYQVVVTDTLSEMLDIRTLRVAGASHPYKLGVSGKGRPVLTWTFDNINLPDSTRDGVGSNGFVKFTVRPLDNLPAGTRIENFADIFFDYNPPVRTNTVFNTLGVLPTEAPGGDAIAITVCRPNPPVSAGPDRFFCDQDSVKLQARSPQYGQGRWKRISGAGTFGEAVNPYSTVTGLGIGPNVFEWSIPDGSCAGDSLHSRVTITRYASPPKPVIAYLGTLELSSGTEGPHYQWYYNGRLLPDDARSIQATRGGTYAVSVANDQCTSALSDPFAFELATPVLARLLKLSPNPANGRFTVTLPEGVTEAAFTVFDALGRKVFHHVAPGTDGAALRQFIDLSPNGAGVYLLKIQTPKAVVVKRIVLGR